MEHHYETLFLLLSINFEIGKISVEKTPKILINVKSLTLLQKLNSQEIGKTV